VDRLSVNGGRGLRPVSGLRPGPLGGSAPDPSGAAPLRPALESKTFLRDENIRRNGLANFRRCDAAALPKTQIRKEPRRRSSAPPPGSSFDYKMLGAVTIHDSALLNNSR
jgi:hypothetical protein